MLGNESLTKYIKTLYPITKINDFLYFNKNNNHFIINTQNELELHSKYTDLIDWKLKDTTNSDQYILKTYILGSIG